MENLRTYMVKGSLREVQGIKFWSSPLIFSDVPLEVVNSEQKQ